MRLIVRVGFMMRGASESSFGLVEGLVIGFILPNELVFGYLHYFYYSRTNKANNFIQLSLMFKTKKDQQRTLRKILNRTISSNIPEED